MLSKIRETEKLENEHAKLSGVSFRRNSGQLPVCQDRISQSWASAKSSAQGANAEREKKVKTESRLSVAIN